MQFQESNLQRTAPAGAPITATISAAVRAKAHLLPQLHQTREVRTAAARYAIQDLKARMFVKMCENSVNSMAYMTVCGRFKEKETLHSM